MKCWVLWIERDRAKLYKKAQYQSNAGLVKSSFRGQLGFTIPDKAKPITLELRRNKTVELWHVDGRTGIALSLEEAEPDHEEPLTIQKPSQKEPVTVQVPIYKKKAGVIGIYPVSDPSTFVKLNVLTKATFYEAIMKKLKLTLLSTLIYMGAGYGLFRFAEYAIRIVFLKEG